MKINALKEVWVLDNNGNTLLMKPLFTCTILYYNTPVFFKISQIDADKYHAEPVNSFLNDFIVKKQLGQWYGESETTHSIAIQIGKQIDKFLSTPGEEEA